MVEIVDGETRQVIVAGERLRGRAHRRRPRPRRAQRRRAAPRLAAVRRRAPVGSSSALGCEAVVTRRGDGRRRARTPGCRRSSAAPPTPSWPAASALSAADLPGDHRADRRAARRAGARRRADDLAARRRPPLPRPRRAPARRRRPACSTSPTCSGCRSPSTCSRPARPLARAARRGRRRRRRSCGPTCGCSRSSTTGGPRPRCAGPTTSAPEFEAFLRDQREERGPDDPSA